MRDRLLPRRVVGRVYDIVFIFLEIGGMQVKNPLSRLGLHASRLEFIHPVTKEMISFHAPMPAVFRDFFGK